MGVGSSYPRDASVSMTAGRSPREVKPSVRSVVVPGDVICGLLQQSAFPITALGKACGDGTLNARETSNGILTQRTRRKTSAPSASSALNAVAFALSVQLCF